MEELVSRDSVGPMDVYTVVVAVGDCISLAVVEVSLWVILVSVCRSVRGNVTVLVIAAVLST